MSLLRGPLPTRQAAMRAIGAIAPADYARTRNHLTGAVTGLSPYLTHGVITLREVLSQVLERQRLRVDHKLVYEFGWREFFRQVWSHEGDGIFQSLHPGPLPDRDYATELPADIRQGRTGVPAIDEAVRTLYSTGTLHNHARMWLASYVVHLRRVHWRTGADWLVAHLLDGDLASNHLSWQWVAGTASHKPYLFNADNVSRYAPAAWHSPGSVIDQSYEALESRARGADGAAWHSDGRRGPQPPQASASPEPLLESPPPEIERGEPPAASQLRGRQVWLIHPWALRAPPPDLPQDAVVIGLYLREYHARWPWPASRWRWVDAAMAERTACRWFIDAPGLVAALGPAAGVRAWADPHIARWLEPFVRLDPASALFPPVERRCQSFSQWWTRATRGLEHAEELL